MNHNKLLLHIEELIKKLDEQQHRLQSFSGEIPALEIDLLQRQVRQLYEYALALEKVRTEFVLPDHTMQSEPVHVSKPTETIADQTATPSVHESPTEHILVEVAKHKEPVADAIPAAGIKAHKIKGDVNTVLYKDKPTIGDKFEDGPSIHEKIASAHVASSIASHQQRKPIHDLKKAIGLNEKFLFINHLFDGNLQVYNQAI